MGKVLDVGSVIGARWRIVRTLTSNTGQGNTYVVVDSKTSDSSAQFVLKVLKEVDQKRIARFDKEIRASLTLKHPNIVKVKDAVYQDTDLPYLVTEYCSGEALTADKILNLSTVERLTIFQRICEAISHAHREGVIHRDLKPSNIFLKDSGSLIPIVGDFGLCFLTGDDPRERPTSNESVGNWEFGPPEGHMGRQESPNPAFDVYNLGKILYWLLSGGITLYREDYEESQYDLRKNGPDQVVYFAYDKIFRKSIDKQAANRYASAVEMLDDARELVSFSQLNGRYLDCELPQPCVFCNLGRYEWRITPLQSFDQGTNRDQFNYQAGRFFGLRFDLDRHGTNVSTYPRILIGRCGRCGNVQQFRLDKEMNLSSDWKNLPEPG